LAVNKEISKAPEYTIKEMVNTITEEKEPLVKEAPKKAPKEEEKF
jgi:vacuolar-type H+-ATPase subunit H